MSGCQHAVLHTAQDGCAACPCDALVDWLGPVALRAEGREQTSTEGDDVSGSRKHFGDRHICTPDCPQAPSITRSYPPEGREATCWCGQPDDRERVHRAHECLPWATSEGREATIRPRRGDLEVATAQHPFRPSGEYVGYGQTKERCDLCGLVQQGAGTHHAVTPPARGTS